MAYHPMKFDIQYYDENNARLLSKHRHAKKIAQLVSRGLQVDEYELFVYTLFRQQKDYPGWRNYQELKEQLPGEIDSLRKYFDTSGGTLRAKFPQSSSDEVKTQSAGVASALMVINAIYDLHEADWERIAITSKRRTLDFEYTFNEMASDGKDKIQVEAKGTVFDGMKFNQDKKNKQHIENKKEAHRQAQPDNTSLFGVITAIPSRPNTNTKCLLLDPPAGNGFEEPGKHQLLSRLYFYIRNLRIISRSRLVQALQNRIRILESAENYTDFDKIPLVNVYGKELGIPDSIYGMTFCEDDIAGHVFPINNKEFVFFAFDLDVYPLLAKQDFNMIRNYRSRLAETFPKTEILKASVSVADLMEFDFPVELFADDFKRKQTVINLEGKIHVGRSGGVIGFLTPII